MSKRKPNSEKRRPVAISMSSKEYELIRMGAENWARLHGPRKTGHTVSVSGFIRDAAIARSYDVLQEAQKAGGVLLASVSVVLPPLEKKD